MLTGRGRLISRDITSELRRIYDENPKFGKIFPQAYSLNVCPNCWYTALPQDFNAPGEENLPLLKELTDYRQRIIQEIFSPLIVDFFEERNLISGAASYILALSCYSFLAPTYSPTIKRGIFSLRGAWLMGDLAEEHQELRERFWKIQEILYLKAKDFYNEAYDFLNTGKENIENVNLGPDTDKNYGYDGFIYIYNYLNFKMSYKIEDIVQKAEIYREIKRNISKIFGIGKASKEKPGPLLDIVRDLYDEVNDLLTEIENTIGGKEVEEA
jgi:uncharacterized protein (DUF2225 family)